MGVFEFILSPLKVAWHIISTFVMSKIICIPFIKVPFQRLDDPKYYGIINAINLRIPVEPGQRIGAWFIRPYINGLVGSSERWKLIESSNLINESEAAQIYESSLQESGTPVLKQRKNHLKEDAKVNGVNTYLTEPEEVLILYLHGNAETRSQYHRRELYKKFQAQGLVVVTIDYRGFGDSYGGFMFQTSESSMAWDGIKCFRFFKKCIHPNSKVIIWGHSLGTGVTTSIGIKNYIARISK